MAKYLEFKQLKELKQALNSVFTVVDSEVYKIYAQFLPSDCLVVDFSEKNKTLCSVEMILTEMVKAGLTRDSVVAVVGGGVAGDVVGFVASIYMRGIDWIFVPSTLIALVDSGIGGKTGVNLLNRKNLIGSFFSASRLIYCNELLLSLNAKQLNNGYAEIIKTASICKKVYKCVKRFGLNHQKTILMCIKTKQSLVKRDFFDKGKRWILNFGHTIGHALELNFNLTHGEAVAIGMRLELILCNINNKKLTDFVNTYTTQIIDKTTFVLNQDVINAIKSDKKSTSDQLVFVIPKKIGRHTQVRLTHSQAISALEKVVKQ